MCVAHAILAPKPFFLICSGKDKVVPFVNYSWIVIFSSSWKGFFVMYSCHEYCIIERVLKLACVNRYIMYIRNGKNYKTVNTQSVFWGDAYNHNMYTIQE